MHKVLGTIAILAVLTLITACNSSDGGVSLVEFEGGGTTTGGSTGGTSGGTGTAGTQTYSVSLLGLELQQKGGTTGVPVGGLPVEGATVSTP